MAVLLFIFSPQLFTLHLSRFRRELTAEARRARSKEFLIKKYSELCELCASAVNPVFFFGCGYAAL